MIHESPKSEPKRHNHLSPSLPISHQPNIFSHGERDQATSSVSGADMTILEAPIQKNDSPPSALRENLFLIFITLTQLVQMVALGAGINSSLAIGGALGATNNESVWMVASYPLTQGAFALIGKSLPLFQHFGLEG